MGGLRRKTVKASMEDFKVARIIIHQKENMCTPSRKKIFQSISQNITNLKALSVKQSSKSRTMESSPRTFEAGKNLGRTTAVSSIGLHSGGKAESWNSTWARNETGKKKLKESFCCFLKKTNNNKKQALPPSQNQYYEIDLALVISLKLSQSWIKVSTVHWDTFPWWKKQVTGCDDSLKELSCLLWFVKFSFEKFISLVSYFTEMVIVITETI